jgi:outer membrane beta-barrel protein
MVRLAATALPLVGSVAWAQDDVLGDDGPAPEDSLREERRSVEEGSSDLGTPGERRKPTILTLQDKTFMKIGRYEAGPFVGFVANDPFLSVYVAGVDFGYHVTEVFGVEVQGTYAPIRARKPITDQIIEENQVTPDISEIQFFANAAIQYSPIYGKVAVFDDGIIMFDVYGVFGTGFVNTIDDLEALQATDEAPAIATESQFHPTLNYGGGIRVIFNPGLAIRVEGRGLSYIEVLESTTLEMKNNMLLQAQASFLFGGNKEP